MKMSPTKAKTGRLLAERRARRRADRHPDEHQRAERGTPSERSRHRTRRRRYQRRQPPVRGIRGDFGGDSGGIRGSKPGCSRIIGGPQTAGFQESGHESSHPFRTLRPPPRRGAGSRRRSPRRGGGGRDPRNGRPERAGRGAHRPLGRGPHLRGERRRPVLRPGLPRRREPPLPVRDVAAAGDRHGGGDPRAVRTAAGHRDAPPPVPEGHGRGDALVPPPRRSDHSGPSSGA